MAVGASEQEESHLQPPPPPATSHLPPLVPPRAPLWIADKTSTQWWVQLMQCARRKYSDNRRQTGRNGKSIVQNVKQWEMIMGNACSRLSHFKSRGTATAHYPRQTPVGLGSMGHGPCIGGSWSYPVPEVNGAGIAERRMV